MRRTVWIHVACIGLIATLNAAAAGQQQPPPAPQTPAFKSRVTVVPVDVRVIDRDGKPVTDLTEKDFTITEDGVPQRIVHFSFQTLTPQPQLSTTAQPEFVKPLGETVAPPTRRTFLIVFGRGRQTGPVKPIESAVRFIKERALPQDQIAILAYNRSTDFTTDHAKVVETLERYRQKHEWIESRLKQWFSGLAAQYSDGKIPDGIQKEIDAIFRAPGALPSRSTTATGITDGARIAADTRAGSDKVQRAEEAANRAASGTSSPFDEAIINEASLIDMPFDEFVESSFTSTQDLGNLYAGIRYLRYLDGEKHLVFVTPGGLFLPRLENSNSIAALANDARVTLDIVHTGGTPGGAPMQHLPPVISGRAAAAMTLASAVPSAGVIFNNNFAIGSSRQIANLTGGHMTTTVTGDKFFKRLDDTTRAQYLLGYSPSNGNWNGAYRTIRVRVNRPGMTVLYRHGYAARLDVKPLNRKDYLSYTRIVTALNRGEPIQDLKITLGEPQFPSPQLMHLPVQIAPEGITFTREGEFHVAHVDCVYFIGDKKQGVAGELWRTLDFKLTPANYEKFQREGVGFIQAVQFSGEARYVKVVVYHYANDQVGSATLTLKKK